MNDIEIITYTTPDNKYILTIEIDWKNGLISESWEEIDYDFIQDEP